MNSELTLWGIRASMIAALFAGCASTRVDPIDREYEYRSSKSWADFAHDPVEIAVPEGLEGWVNVVRMDAFGHWEFYCQDLEIAGPFRSGRRFRLPTDGMLRYQQTGLRINSDLRLLCEVPYLAEVMLNDATITDADALAALMATQYLDKVLVVSLPGLGLGKVVTALSQSNSICILEIRDDARARFSSEELAQLGKMKGLEWLNVSCRNFNDDAARALLGCHSLQVLSVSGGSLTDAGIGALAEHPKLHYLGVSDNPRVSDEAIERFYATGVGATR